MLLSIENNLTNLPQTLNTYLSTSVVAGGTSLPVKNINSFSDKYAVQIGQTGQEQSEIRIINTPSGGSMGLNTGTLVYGHGIDTPVYGIHYDQIVIKRSTAGTSGTATALATASITPDSLYTEYDDTTGVSTYAYKTHYRNSVSTDVSSDSDWFTPSGPAFYELGKLRKRAKDTLYNSSYLPDDGVVDDWINEWIEEMTNAAIKVNQGFAIGTAAYAFGTAGYGTITEAGFRKATKIEVTWNSSGYVPSSEIPMHEYSDYDAVSSIYPRHSWEGDTVFRILPYGSLGTARFSFNKLNTYLTDETDAVPVPFRGYTTGCVEYVRFRAYGKDEKDGVGDSAYAKHLKIKQDFVNEMTPRDATGPQSIDLVEGLSARNEFTDYLV